MSIVPVAEYNSVSLDKNNTLVEPFDFATPHFENLGFEGIFGYQLDNNYMNIYNNFLVDDSHDAPAAFRKTLGFAPRYLNYKTAFDKVHGEFQSNMRVDIPFTLNWQREGDDPAVITAFEPHFTQLSGSLAHWTTPRTDIESASDEFTSYPVEMLHVNPASLNNIFYTNVDSYQYTDQFLCNTNFVINSVRSLSVLGLPRW